VREQKEKEGQRASTSTTWSLAWRMTRATENIHYCRGDATVRLRASVKHNINKDARSGWDSRASIVGKGASKGTTWNGREEEWYTSAR
jgi:hypothetical protein